MAVRFDLVDLRLLVHVAEAGSLGRGAERSNLSAPAASLRIKQIENRLGARLFHRHAQGLAPTWIGRDFVRRARQIIRQVDELQDELAGYARGRKGRIRLAATSTAISEFIPGALGTFLQTHPGIDVDVKESLSADTVAALIRDGADVGVISDNVPAPGLELRPFQPDPLVLVASERHPLARHERLHAAQALDFDIVALPLAGRIHGFLAGEAAAHGKTLRIKLEVENVSAACRMVEADVGVSVLPLSSAQRHARTLAIRLVPLVDPWANHALWICVRSFEALPPFVRDFVDLLMSEASVRDGTLESHAAG